jgi:Putative mono-oxygenase ydhR
MSPTDHIQVVTFQLEGLEPAAYRAHCEAAAPAFTEIPGLRAKTWLANPSTNTYGGVYVWESREAMEAYVSGGIFGALLANPRMAHVTTRDFGVLERPTEITRWGSTGRQRCSRRPLEGAGAAG